MIFAYEINHQEPYNYHFPQTNDWLFTIYAKESDSVIYGVAMKAYGNAKTNSVDFDILDLSTGEETHVFDSQELSTKSIAFDGTKYACIQWARDYLTQYIQLTGINPMEYDGHYAMNYINSEFIHHEVRDVNAMLSALRKSNPIILFDAYRDEPVVRLTVNFHRLDLYITNNDCHDGLPLCNWSVSEHTGNTWQPLDVTQVDTTNLATNIEELKVQMEKILDNYINA